MKVWPVFGLLEEERVLNIPEEEPVKIVSLKDFFLVATVTGKVLVYKLGSRTCKLVHQFTTASFPIHDIQYMESTDFILTLEKEDNKSQIKVVRMYMNWRNADSARVSPPSSRSCSPSSSPIFLVPGLTSLDDSSLSNSTSDSSDNEFPTNPNWSSSQLKFEKLPFPSSINHLGVCSSRRGKLIAVSTDTYISIWTLSLNKPPEWLLNIQHLGVKEICIFFDFVAFCTDTEVFVLKIKFQHVGMEKQEQVQPSEEMAEEMINKFNEQRKKKVSELVSISELYIPPRYEFVSVGKRGQSNAFVSHDDIFLSNIFYNQEQQASALVPIMNLWIPSIGKNPSTDNSTFGEVLGPRPDLHVIETNVESEFKLISVTMLFFRKFTGNTNVHSLSFTPEFEQDVLHVYAPNPLVANASKSPFPKLKSIRFFFSTPSDGYLYNIYGSTIPIITYSYSQQCFRAEVVDDFVHALTSKGLYVSALRTYDCINGNLSEPPLWIGEKMIAGLTHLITCSPFIVLLSKTTIEQELARMSVQLGKVKSGLEVYSKKSNESPGNSNVGWKISVIHNMSLLQLHSNLCEKINQADGQHLSFQLLLEAHFLLLNRLTSLDSAVCCAQGARLQSKNNTILNTGSKTLSPTNGISHRHKDNTYKGKNTTTTISTTSPNCTPATQNIILSDLQKVFTVPSANPSASTTTLNQTKHPMTLSNTTTPKRNRTDLKTKYQEILHLRSKLCTSYTHLGNNWTREINDDKRMMKAQLCYAQSDAPISHVVNAFLTESVPDFNNFINYLNRVLFDKAKVEQASQHDEVLGNTLLVLYQKYCPEMLGKVLLESSLTNYQLEVALELLQKVKEKHEVPTKSLHEINIALTLFFLDTGEYGEALKHLSYIPDLALVQYCTNHSNLLAPDIDDKKVLTLGLLLRDGAPWALLEILIRLRHLIPLKRAMTILSTSHFNTLQTSQLISDNLLLQMCFLEFLVTFEVQKISSDISILDFFSESNPADDDSTQYSNRYLVMRLLKLYLTVLEQPTEILEILFNVIRLSQLNSVSTPSTLRTKNGKKINKNGSILEKAIQEQEKRQLDDKWKYFHAMSITVNRYPYLDKLGEMKKLDEGSVKLFRDNPFYVHKMEGLLSSPVTLPFVSLDIYKLISEKKLLSQFSLSFYILCLSPDMRLQTGCKMLVEGYPNVLFDFSQKHCQLPQDWKLVMDILASRLVLPSLTNKQRDEVCSVQDCCKVVHMTEVKYVVPRQV
eukprot:TRINITY_DN7077_c0_g3_i3.p1 TRINITY_DN7077_c0_g3~~TRINITY_DN7077_c0_g3_i3.p1  ORF type:complete len:1241 (+),score=248.22 TRINITY_DN7077_c0_g3_i3:64-3786(+)